MSVQRNNCTWNVTVSDLLVSNFLILKCPQATEGNVTLLLDKLDLQWSKECKGANHLYVGNVDRYTEVCLANVSSIHFSFSRFGFVDLEFHALLVSNQRIAALLSSFNRTNWKAISVSELF